MLEIKDHKKFFWIEQHFGSSFQFECENGIVKFLAEEFIDKDGNMSLDSKVLLKLKEKFNGKHIKELKKQVDKMPFWVIKNSFVANEFEKSKIYKWRRIPESWHEQIADLKNLIEKAKKNSHEQFFVETYKSSIKELEERIKLLPINKEYVNAKLEYDNNVVHTMRMLHGIVYGYNNIVDFE